MKEPELALPEGKTSFKPEELYRFTKIKPFVLRFWESEFPSLKPRKTGDGGLAYSRADVEMILAIKHLLYDQGITLADARRRLSGEEETVPEPQKKPAAKKKKTSAGRKAKPATPAPPAGSSKSQAKRGMPAEGDPRSRVSLEELLPGSARGPAGRKDKAVKPSAKIETPVAAAEVPELRQKLAEVLQELREMLTFLRKGDR